MSLKEGTEWIQVAEDKVHLAGSCEHGKEPSGYTKGAEFD
jgi:hypothetical protein